jgi:hypothetical protein
MTIFLSLFILSSNFAHSISPKVRNFNVKILGINFRIDVILIDSDNNGDYDWVMVFIDDKICIDEKFVVIANPGDPVPFPDESYIGNFEENLCNNLEKTIKFDIFSSDSLLLAKFESNCEGDSSTYITSTIINPNYNPLIINDINRNYNYEITKNSENLIIESKTEHLFENKFVISDLLGNVLKSGQILNNNNSFLLNIGNLYSGEYFLVIYSNDNLYLHKFLIIK